jgi:hypothetical protein
MLDDSEVDRLVDCTPQAQCECGGLVVLAGAAQRHQVFEVPPLRAQVDEYRLYSGHCAGCGKAHSGVLSTGVPKGQLGPRALSLVGVLGTRYHLTQRKIRNLLDQLMGLMFSVGAISQAHGKVAGALKTPVAEAAASMRNADALWMDETHYRREGIGNWVWAAARRSDRLIVGRCRRRAATVPTIRTVLVAWTPPQATSHPSEVRPSRWVSASPASAHWAHWGPARVGSGSVPNLDRSAGAMPKSSTKLNGRPVVCLIAMRPEEPYIRQQALSTSRLLIRALPATDTATSLYIRQCPARTLVIENSNHPKGSSRGYLCDYHQSRSQADEGRP